MIKIVRMIGMSALAAGLGLLTVQDVARAQDVVHVTTTGNVGMGTSTPAERLHVLADSNANSIILSENTNTGANAAGVLRAQSNTSTVNFQAHGSGRTIARFGQTLGGWNEFLAPQGNGLIIGTSNNTPLILGTANVNRLHITSGGNIGIGTASPAATFHIASGEMQIPGGTASTNGWPTHFNWLVDGRNYIRGTTLIADDGGSVGIGTPTPSSKLHVNGGDIRVSGGSFIDDGVTLNVPDYVFEPGYRLMPLDELRAFVEREKHLPNVPSAEDVKKEGLNLSQVQMRLLEKLEELTLYTLKQDEEIKTLRARLEELEKVD